MSTSAVALRPIVRRSLIYRPTTILTHHRVFSTGSCHRNNAVVRDSNGDLDVEKLLSEPTWSVSSLLPTDEASEPSLAQISPRQLHHLLRLSALPPPKDAEEEAKMLATLSSQLLFVQEIQKVDTADVEPLRSLRDETIEGEKEAELGLSALSEALAAEEVRGKWHKRIRRSEEGEAQRTDDWNPLGTASRKVGRFLVVEGGKAA